MAYLLITLAFFLAAWCAFYLAFAAWCAAYGGRWSVAASIAAVVLAALGLFHTLEAIEREHQQIIHRAN